MAGACKDLDSALFTKVIPGAPVYSSAPRGLGKCVLHPTAWLSQALDSLLLGPPPPPPPGDGRSRLGAAVSGWSLDSWGTLPDEGQGPRLGGTGPVPRWHSLRRAPAVSGRPSVGLAAWTPRRKGSASKFTGGLEVPAWGTEGGGALPRSPEPGSSGIVRRAAKFRAPCRVGEGARPRSRRFAG